jgi:hypothetical protein
VTLLSSLLNCWCVRNRYNSGLPYYKLTVCEYQNNQSFRDVIRYSTMPREKRMTKLQCAESCCNMLMRSDKRTNHCKEKLCFQIQEVGILLFLTLVFTGQVVNCSADLLNISCHIYFTITLYRQVLDEVMINASHNVR